LQHGAFSYSKSQVDTVINYIKNQEQHHEVKTFQEEYLGFLKLFGIDYDERDLFKEPV
jgi:putative transposase